MGDVASEVGIERIHRVSSLLYGFGVWLPRSSLGFAPMAVSGTKSRPPYVMEMKIKEVIGIDGYNQTVTGNVSRTITCAATDCDHVPLVIIRHEKSESRTRSGKGNR